MICRKGAELDRQVTGQQPVVRGVAVDCQVKVGKKMWKEGGGKTLSEVRERGFTFIALIDPGSIINNGLPLLTWIKWLVQFWISRSWRWMVYFKQAGQIVSS